MNIIIRDEQAEDIEAIEELTKAAFKNAEHTSHTEHSIVNSLRDHGQLTISLVAIDAARTQSYLLSIFDSQQSDAHDTHHLSCH